MPLLFASLLMTAFSGTAMAGGVIVPPGGGPGGPGGGGTVIGGGGTVCWSLTGSPSDPGAICYGCPCVACVVAGQIPIDNVTKLDFAQQPAQPTGGWSCGIPGPAPVPPFTFPSINAHVVGSLANGKITLTNTTHTLVLQKPLPSGLAQGSSGACPLTTTVISGHTSSKTAPTVPAPPIGSNPVYTVSKSAVPADCPDAFYVHGQDANYEFVFQEVLAEDPETGCTAAAPYLWKWTATSANGNSTACSQGTGTYDDQHVATGVKARTSVWWQPYCSAWILAKAAGTTTTFAWTAAASTTNNGITIKCDPKFQQTFGPSPAFNIFQIEPVAAG